MLNYKHKHSPIIILQQNTFTLSRLVNREILKKKSVHVINDDMI